MFLFIVKRPLYISSCIAITCVLQICLVVMVMGVTYGLHLLGDPGLPRFLSLRGHPAGGEAEEVTDRQTGLEVEEVAYKSITYV